MSVRTMARVWAHSRHKGTELLMMLALADFADDEGTSYPAVATLAEKCRMSSRNVNHLLAELRDSGELDIRFNEGPRGTNRYCIVLPDDTANSVRPLKPASSPAPEAGFTPTPEEHFTPEAHFTLKPVAPTPEACSSKPLKPASDEPSLNHQEPSSIVRSTSRGSNSTSEHPLFGEFYAAYPRKVARPSAAKAFRALDPDRTTLDAMLLAIRAQGLRDRCNRGEGRFVPHPATWLNGRRWEDTAASPAVQVASDSRPTWAIRAGFSTRYDAENAGCRERTAHLFRDGRRIEVTA